MKKILTIIIILILGVYPASGKNKKYEKDYQKTWCAENNGRAEVVLPDRTRCDCLTETHAVEVEFGKHWYSGIGQSLYYGLQTGKRPGIVLILEKQKDLKYWIRLNSTIKFYDLPITTWKIENF